MRKIIQGHISFISLPNSYQNCAKVTKKKTILNSIYRKNFFVFAYFQKKTAGKAAAAAPAATTEKAGKAGGKGGKKGEINHNDAIHAFYASASKLSIF